MRRRKAAPSPADFNDETWHWQERLDGGHRPASSLPCGLLLQAPAEAIDQADGNRELLLHAAAAEAGERGVGRDTEDEARRTVEIERTAKCAAKGELVAEKTERGRRSIADAVLEVAVGSAGERVQGKRSVLVAGAAPLGAGHEHVFTHERSGNAIRVGDDAGGAVVSANAGRRGPAGPEETCRLHIESAKVGALQKVGTGIEVRIGEAAVKFHR